jgi:hypothetical protein
MTTGSQKRNKIKAKFFTRGSAGSNVIGEDLQRNHIIEFQGKTATHGSRGGLDYGPFATESKASIFSVASSSAPMPVWRRSPTKPSAHGLTGPRMPMWALHQSQISDLFTVRPTPPRSLEPPKSSTRQAVA